MVRSAWGGSEGADVTVHMVDAQAQWAVQQGEAKGADKRAAVDVHTIIEGLRAAGRKAILAINKIDHMKRENLLAIAHAVFATTSTTGCS